ncbi:LysR family transcriptional regulator [Amycolatopsis sp. NPDC059021]|uniref:helix-turn-helix domain-containing protein n=1 Tax=Amycolatopsis sp. NPDC059021 TaxID=3346704 RepID=UPI0036732C97
MRCPRRPECSPTGIGDFRRVSDAQTAYRYDRRGSASSVICVVRPNVPIEREHRSRELRQVEHFPAVARSGSLTAAAPEVHVVQSALSASIRKLEAELGNPLRPALLP